MAGERSSLVRHAFHKIAVGADSESEVIDDLVAGLVEEGGEISFCDRHAHAGSEPLSERAGGHFHAGRENVFRMPGGFTSPLPELLEIIEGEIVAGEKQKRIEEHGAVPGG